MTTYFYQDGHGTGYSHVLPNIAPVYLATALVPGSALSAYWHDMAAQLTASDGGDSKSEQSPSGDGYIGQAMSDETAFGVTGADAPYAVNYGGDIFRYPNPEMIRDYHSLRSLLPYIQPARLRNSVYGPTLDIVEEGTDRKFATAVPKKLLVLFCGRKVVNRFLRTIEQKYNGSRDISKVVQELCFPRYFVNHVGVQIVIAWMHQACYTPEREMKPIRIPENLFAALSLSRTLTALGLHRDANRVDKRIANHHYKRPMYPDEIVSIWNCLPKDSKYTYRMIEDLRQKRSEYENGQTKVLPDAEKVLLFLEQHPELKARVDDEDYNNREEFLPFFGTEWCQRAAIQTQNNLSGFCDVKGSDAYVPGGWSYSSTPPDKKHDRHRKYGIANHGKKHSGGNARVRTISLNDWEPKTPPSAWPRFENPIVLSIVDAGLKVHSSTHDRNDLVHGIEGKLA